ncbi:MAG: nuclear transport factor 2 family protein [Inhella sp.]
MSHEATIRAFYEAFQKLDGEAMQRAYADDATFEDEAFSLRGPREIGGMWRMLCDATKAKGMAHWRLEVSDITDRSAHWEAHYLFSATGRLVHNKIDAAFEFAPDGRIRRHRDRFDFWRWSRQALGTPGLLLGWSPMLRNKVRATAAGNLQRYLSKSA